MDSEEEHEDEIEEEYLPPSCASPLFSDPEDLPQTPSKKRARKTATPIKIPNEITTPSASTTPRRSRRINATPITTPHSKAAVRDRARKKANTKTKSPPVPLLEDNYSKQIEQLNLPEDPWLRAMHLLHVAARPDALPCREEEFVRILRAVGELLEEGSGGCVCTYPTF